MTSRIRALGLAVPIAVAITVVLAACAAGVKTAAPSPAPPAAPSPEPPAPAGSPATLTSAGPSVSAQMICGPEIRGSVAAILALSTRPQPTSTWADHVYTCTYHLAQGPLVLSVTESGTPAAGKAHFDALQQRLAPTQTIPPPLNLDLPAFQKSDGRVVFLKDDKTLLVDPTALPEEVAAKETREAMAYELAIDIMGCWSGA